MIKLIALDMDGTLLDSSKTISAANKLALQQAAQLGIQIVLCTGRPKSGIQPYVDELALPMDDYVIGNNGCFILHSKDWQVVHQTGIEIEQLDYLASLLEDFPSLNLVLFTLDANYVIGQEVNAAARHDAQVEFSTLYHVELEAFKVLEIPVLVPIFMGEEKVLDAFQERFEEALREEFSPVRSLDYAFEALPLGISKAAALAKLTTVLGLQPQQVMAIGDGNNDLEMLEWAGLSIAMGNAHPKIQALADDVTDSNDQSGVAKAISKYILNQD